METAQTTVHRRLAAFRRGRTARCGCWSVIALGTMGFGMADVLLEPYGGQVLGLTVAQTTKLTAVLALAR
jgi:BCD family chlorophyll transporter-like MFS transporter